MRQGGRGDRNSDLPEGEERIGEGDEGGEIGGAREI